MISREYMIRGSIERCMKRADLTEVSQIELSPKVADRGSRSVTFVSVLIPSRMRGKRDKLLNLVSPLDEVPLELWAKAQAVPVSSIPRARSGMPHFSETIKIPGGPAK